MARGELPAIRVEVKVDPEALKRYEDAVEHVADLSRKFEAAMITVRNSARDLERSLIIESKEEA